MSDRVYIQHYLVVNSVEGRREVEADHDGAVMISTYVGKMKLKLAGELGSSLGFFLYDPMVIC